MALKIGKGLDLQSQKIINQADPTAAQDSATKNYVDTRLYARMVTSAVTSSATSAADITGLTITALPAGSYIVDAFLVYRVATVTTTIGFGVTGGTLTSLSLSRKRYITASTFAVGTLQVAYGTAIIAGSTAATTDLEATLSGRLVTSGAGDFKVQFASGTSAIVCTIQPGSWLTVTPA